MVGLFLYFHVLSNQRDDDDDDDDMGKSSQCSECRQFIHILSFFINNNLLSQKYCDVCSYSLFAGHLGRKLTLFDTSVVMRLLRRNVIEVKNSSVTLSHFLLLINTL